MCFSLNSVLLFRTNDDYADDDDADDGDGNVEEEVNVRTNRSPFCANTPHFVILCCCCFFFVPGLYFSWAVCLCLNISYTHLCVK